MSKLPPNVEAAGLRAYEQVRAFAEVERQHRPLESLGWMLLPLAAGILEWRLNHPEMGIACLIVAILFPFLTAWQMRWLRARDLRNKQLLAELESQYGRDLPWLEVERHLAALKKLQDELAAEKREEEKG